MSHRLIMHWNQWLNQSLGQLIVQTEQEVLKTFLSEVYGKHAVLVGVPHQCELLNPLLLACHLLVTPLHHHSCPVKVIESSLHELPLASGSVDLVLLPHTLELVDNPRQLLAEACRIVKPEGHLIVCGFNIYSMWGLKKLFLPIHSSFPVLHSLTSGMVKKWLNLSDFQLVQETTTLYRPPIQNSQVFKKLHFLEWMGHKSRFPWGAVYVLMAKAKVIPLTPIRWRWKQRLAGMPIPTHIPGPSIRNIRNIMK